jgi:hypothetical protein
VKSDAPEAKKKIICAMSELSFWRALEMSELSPPAKNIMCDVRLRSVFAHATPFLTATNKSLAQSNNSLDGATWEKAHSCVLRWD